MKLILTIVGVVMVILGGIWFLQGIGVLPGSFMTGQIRWAVYGAVLAIGGVALIIWTRRRPVA